MAIIASLVIAGVGVALSAAAAGYGAYSSNQAARQQAKAAGNMAERQSEADQAAGEARRQQVLYDAKRKAAGIRTREAAAGVQIGQGSLLEDEMQYAADSEYAAQIAQLPYQVAADAAQYEGRIFASTAKRIGRNTGLVTGVAAGSTLATGAGSIAGAYGRGPATTPAATNIDV